MKKLGLSISTPSNVVVITASGIRTRALGKIENVKIAVQDLLIPIHLQVMDSVDETLLLGTDWFNKTCATLSFDTQTLHLKYLRKTVEVQTTHVKGNELPNIYEQEDDDDLVDELQQEESKEEYEEQYEQEDLKEAETYHSEVASDDEAEEDQPQGLNLATFLAEMEELDSHNVEVYYTQDINGFNIGPLEGNVKDQAIQLLNNNSEIFANNISEEGQTTELTQTNLVQHEISTGNARPIKQRAYRAPPDTNEFLKKEIDTMLDKSIIRESSSPWSSPVVVVPKHNGKLRMCIDFRKLNAVTEKDNYPLPLISEVLETFGKAKYFSTIDLASGYWQVQMNEADKKKTAFITKFGTYEFNVMPFGLCNAPATFQRLMDRVLRSYIGKIAVVYLDDITVYSRTFEQHVQDLQAIFNALRTAQLKLNRDKCHFFLQTIKFLGHVIDTEGVHPDEDKVTKVKNFPQPNDLRHLRGFLGLASYY